MVGAGVVTTALVVAGVVAALDDGSVPPAQAATANAMATHAALWRRISP